MNMQRFLMLAAKVFLLAWFGVLVACTNIQGKAYRTIAIENKSSALVKQITVVVGQDTIRFDGQYRPGSGTSTSGDTNFPGSITVTWLSGDDRPHRETLPVKLIAATRWSLEALRIEFRDHGLELYQGIGIDKYSQDYTRIFP